LGIFKTHGNWVLFDILLITSFIKNFLNIINEQLDQPPATSHQPLRLKLKHFIKLFSFLITLFIFTSSCEDEFFIEQENYSKSNLKYKTVSIDEALKLFEEDKTNSNKLKGGINLQPDLSSIRQERIQNTNEYITIISATTKHKKIETSIVLVKYNDSIVKVLVNLIPNKKGIESKFNGVVSITKLDGKFINGYRVENGIFKSKFVKRKDSKNKFKLAFKDVPDEDENGCSESLNVDSEFCNPLLDEIVLGGSSNSSPGISIIWIPSTMSYSYTIPNNAIDNDNGSGNTSTGSDSEEVFPCDDPLHGCDEDTTITCPEGQIKDSNDNCVDDPCHTNNINNPIKNPIVAKSNATNVNGGRFGYTRTSGKTFHDGLDAKAAINTPFTPILNGIVVKIYKDAPNHHVKFSYGNYIIVKSNVDGNNVYLKYNHLNRVDIENGDSVTTNDIIGLTGESGNARKTYTSHIHIQVRPSLDFGKGSYRRYDTTKDSKNNPEIYINQKFNDDGSRKTPCINQ